MFGSNPFVNPVGTPLYGGMFQPQPYACQQVPQRHLFSTRQVSNIEEAKAFLIDPLQTYLFVDVNAGKIYMKRMNENGLSDFFTFAAEEGAPSLKDDPLSSIGMRLDRIEKILGGQDDDKPVPDGEPRPEPPADDDGTDGGKESSAFSKGAANDFWKRRG